MATRVEPQLPSSTTSRSRRFPAPAERAWGDPRRPHGYRIGDHVVLGQFVVDLRDQAPDHFEDVSATDWSTLDWSRIGRPYSVEKWSGAKRDWESANGQPLPVFEGWQRFNRSFHSFFLADVPADTRAARDDLAHAIAGFDAEGARDAVADLLLLAVWNRIHRVEDAVWDPRGKRALFDGLDVKKPRILFLGAADGYEAMQLAAMYPGGDVTLVDYDPFCATDRFGKFPQAYPFLGVDPSTGHQRVWYREEMPIRFEVADIRDLDYGREFDVVVSIGLIEHFPDEYKAEAFAMHHRFLKPGGYAIITTPRNQRRSRLFYNVMADFMNFGYRELMDVWQMGRYTWENGFEILRAGVIKAHNGLIARAR